MVLAKSKIVRDAKACNRHLVAVLTALYTISPVFNRWDDTESPQDVIAGPRVMLQPRHIRDTDVQVKSEWILSDTKSSRLHGMCTRVVLATNPA